VLVQTDDVRSNNAVMRLLNARLIARHPGVDDFSLLDFSGVMARFGAIFTAMKLIIAVLAGISLLVGGVGVLNIMLVAVSERAREIGVRRALGARRSSIAAQFLSEACLLASGGGAMGVLLGLGVAFAMSRLIVHFLPAWQPSLAPSAALFAEGSTLIIGAVFGVLPARRASNLDPASAMRL
jgi:putative ABC transport system permease protein